MAAPREILTLNTKLFMDEEELKDLLSTPDLGIGDPEKIEVTNLADDTRRYINGLKDIGDSLEFEFNYVAGAEESYAKLAAAQDAKEVHNFKVELPDGLSFEFEAMASVKITGAAVGEQVKFTLNLTPYSAITVSGM